MEVHGWNGLRSMIESDGGAWLDRAEKHGWIGWKCMGGSSAVDMHGWIEWRCMVGLG